MLAVETLTNSLKELHIGLATAHLIIEDAQKAIAWLHETRLHGGVVVESHRWQRDLLGFQLLDLPLEKALLTERDERLVRSVIEQLVE